MEPLVSQGAPIKAVILDPNFAVPDGAGALGWSKHPNAARVYLDWLLSAKGQETLCLSPDQPVIAYALNGTPNSLDPATMDPYDPTDYQSDDVEKYRPEFGALYK